MNICYLIAFLILFWEIKSKAILDLGVTFKSLFDARDLDSNFLFKNIIWDLTVLRTFYSARLAAVVLLAPDLSH